MTDILIRLVDLIHQFLDRDIVLAGVSQTLVERLLQLGILGLSSLECLLESLLLILKGLDTGILTCQILSGLLQLLGQRFILRLAIGQIFLTGTACHQQTGSDCDKQYFLLHTLSFF